MQGKKATFFHAVACKVAPRAAHNRWIWDKDLNLWKVSVTAPPDKGKANQAVIEFCAEILGISKSSIRIVQGFTTTRKVLQVATSFSLEEIEKKFLLHNFCS